MTGLTWHAALTVFCLCFCLIGVILRTTESIRVAYTSLLGAPVLPMRTPWMTDRLFEMPLEQRLRRQRAKPGTARDKGAR